MIIERMEQGSEEWNKARVGNLGASSLDKIITSTGKKSTQRTAFLYKMAGEILTGENADGFSSFDMERGLELEPKARQFFQIKTGLKVEEVGLIYPDDRKRWHVSPDGLVLGENTGLEIKCPKLHTAVEYLHKGKLPAKYKAQVQGSMLCTGYESWYFMSYFPGLKPFLLEVERDEYFINLLEDAINLFCDDLEDLVAKLN